MLNKKDKVTSQLEQVGEEIQRLEETHGVETGSTFAKSGVGGDPLFEPELAFPSDYYTADTPTSRRLRSKQDAVKSGIVAGAVAVSLVGIGVYIIKKTLDHKRL